jgi:hypothetical protein
VVHVFHAPPASRIIPQVMYDSIDLNNATVDSAVSHQEKSSLSLTPRRRAPPPTTMVEDLLEGPS